MIDTTKQRTITKSGVDIVTQGDHETQIFTFGKVLLLRDDYCIVRVVATNKKVNMPLVYPAVIDGVTYHADIEDAAAPVESDKPKRTGPKRGEGPTKMDLCKEIFAANKDKPKAEVIALFVSEAKCTPAGANTYYLTCKKQG